MIHCWIPRAQSRARHIVGAQCLLMEPSFTFIFPCCTRPGQDTGLQAGLRIFLSYEPNLETFRPSEGNQTLAGAPCLMCLCPVVLPRISEFLWLLPLASFDLCFLALWYPGMVLPLFAGFHKKFHHIKALNNFPWFFSLFLFLGFGSVGRGHRKRPHCGLGGPQHLAAVSSPPFTSL